MGYGVDYGYVNLAAGCLLPTLLASARGRLHPCLRSAEGGEDSAASQTLVPFILGTLLDHNKVRWGGVRG